MVPARQRPNAALDRRYTPAWLCGAVRPGTDDTFALVRPAADAASMQVFLDRFAQDLAPGAHAALLMDQAGWILRLRVASGDLVGMGAALWVHGHPHDGLAWEDGNGTLVVCNSAGYEPERSSVGSPQWSRSMASASKADAQPHPGAGGPLGASTPMP